MSISPIRPAFLGAALLAISSFASPASAASVKYDGECFRSAEIVQWTPQKGPIARFVVDTFLLDKGTGVWIGLGRSGTSFWSAEGSDVNDACDDCRVLHLVETRADGTRKRYEIWDRSNHREAGMDAAAEKAHMLAALWKLAGGVWPVDKLTQDYSLKLGRPDAPNASANQMFAVEIQTKNVLNLRYDFGVSKLMCWCRYDWKAQSRR